MSSKLKSIYRLGRLEYLSPREVKLFDYPIAVGHTTVEEDFVESVCKHGVITPIIAVKDGNDVRVIDGIRRLRAADKCNVERVPVFVLALDIQNPDHYQMALALSIALRYAQRGATEEHIDFRYIANIVKFLGMYLTDEDLNRMKTGVVPSSVVKMLSDLIGITTNTAYNWIKKVMNEYPEVIIALLKTRGLIKEEQQVQQTQEQPKESIHQQPPPQVQTVTASAPVAVQSNVVESAVPQSVEEVRAVQQPEQQRTVQPTETQPPPQPVSTTSGVVMCKSNPIPAGKYDMLLSDPILKQHVIRMCRSGVLTEHIVDALLAMNTYEKLKYIDETTPITANSITLKVPASTKQRLDDIAVKYRISQTDLAIKLGMALYALIRLIHESGEDKKQVLDNISRAAFGPLDAIRAALRDL